MRVVLWGVVLLSVVGVILAMRRSWKLQKEVNHLKRDLYDISNRLKRIPEVIRDAVQPLRVHLAKVAEGGTVPRDMILDGRLYRDVTASEAQGFLAQAGDHPSPKSLWVDVRTPKEFSIRRVPGAKLVPFDELESRYREEIPEDAEKVFVYCLGGERSRFACDFLSSKGYTNLYHIRDGLQSWHGPTEGEGQVTIIQIDRREPSPIR